MICPACKSGNEMAYSALIHGFVCTEPECGVEIEMEMADIAVLLADDMPTAEQQQTDERVYA